MAKYGRTLAEVKVFIDGKEQAKKALEELTAEADKYKKAIADSNKKMQELAKAIKDDPKKVVDYENERKNLARLEREYKKLKRSISETEKLAADIEKDLDNMSNLSVSKLRALERQLKAVQSNLSPKKDPNGTFIAFLNESIKKVSDAIKSRRGEFVEFESIMAKISHVDDRSLDNVIKRLKELIATTDKLDGDKMTKYIEQLAFAEETKRQRTLQSGEKVITRVEQGVFNGTITENQEAIKLLEEYKKLLKTSDTKGLDRVNSVMDQLKQNIKETESGFLSFEKAMKKAQGVMSGAFDPTLDDLEQIQKVLKEGMQNKFHIANPEDEAQLKQTLGLMEEMLKKQKEVMRLNHQDKVDAVSGKLDKVSPAEIEEAVKAAKELQQVAKTKEEFIQLGEFIGKAEARLKDWNETSKQSVMKSQIKDLSAIRALSDSALQDQLKFWEGTMNAAKKTSTAYKDAKKNFEDLQAESKRRLQFEGEKVINDVKLGVGDGSTKQMQERLKLLQDYRAVIDGTKPDAYKAVDEAILKLTEDIKASQAGFLSFDKALERAKQVSDGTFKPTLEDLEQIQKALKEGMQSKFNLVDDADIDQLKETRRLMDEMAKKQAEADRIRLKDQATEILGGDYTKTIEGTKQAIELLKKYQDTLDTTSPDAINEVTKSINKMKEELESASRAKAAEVMANPFRFSPEEINEAIKYTEKLQASVNDVDAYHKLQLQIERAKQARDEFAENSKHEIMVAQFGQLEKLSVNALAEQKKYWEAMRDSGKYLDNPIKKLEEIAKLEKERLKEDADKVMGGDYTHTIEGTQQAIKLLEKYQGTLNATDTGAIEAVTESIKKMNAELETATRERAEKVMQNPTGFSPEQIEEAIKYTEKLQKATPDGKEWTEYAKQIAAAKEARDKFASDAKFEIMSEQFKQFDTLSKDAAEQQTKYWEGLAKSMAETDPRYQTVLDNIQKIKDSTKAQLEGEAFKVMGGDYTKTIEGTKQAIELLKKYQETLEATDADSINLVNEAIREMNTELDTAAKKSARETLTTNLNTAGTEDIKKAVEWLTKYQGTLEPLSQEWREINKEIEAGNDRLKAVSDRTKLDAMTDQFRNLNKLSTSALADQQKYWQSVLDNAQKGTVAYIQAERKLQAISQETTARREAQAGAVMGDLAKHSVAEIQEAIKMTEQLRDAQKAGSAEYEIYNNEIKQAKEYLQSYIDLNKQADMEDKWNNLTTLSANALAEQKKYWQEMVNGAKQGSQELQDYQDKLKAVVEEEQFRLDNKYIKVMNNPDQYSVRELEEAIKHFEKLRDEQRLGSGEWDYYASMVNRASEQLKAFKDGAKLDAMEKQFADLSNLSVNAFAEQKKYWQGLRDSLEATDPLYTKAIDNLKQITDLENNRIKTDATQAIFDVKFGNWDKTIEETQQAIKLIEEYKKQLKTKSDADAIDDANKAIAELNANLGKVKEALMSVQEAINIGTQIKEGTFDGTTEEVLRAKKALEEYRKTLKQKTDADTIKLVDEALRNVTNSAEQAKGKLVDIEDVLKHLDKASMEDLQAAAKQLQDQLAGASRKTSDYADNAAKLRQVNLELKRAKKEWEGQENVIARTAKRLMAYVAVYGGFNEIWGRLKEVYRSNLELSDSLADIQKTTGLSAESVANLSNQINAIDTRSAQKELHDLAYEAGKLGISAEEDVLSFVRAGNQLLVALGEDLGGAEAVRQLMKVNAILGETQELGVEKALLSTGSAINEISQTSRASAGPIADMVSRMGAIGSAAGLSMADLIALAGTADSLGQSAEVAATAFNKFISTLTSNPVDVAYALGMNPDQIQQQINAGNTMQVIQDIFAKMNQMGNMADLAPIMGELGSEGARMTQVLVTMAQGVSELNAQVFTSKRAFEEATSVTNEYNIKNESAAAIVQRMGNNIREAFTNSTLVEWLREVLQWLYYIPNALERNRAILFLVRVLLWDIASVALVKLVAMLKTSLVGALGSATLAWKSFYIQAAAVALQVKNSEPHWRIITLRKLAAAGAVGKLRIAFLALGNAIKSNPIFFIGTVIGGIIAVIHQLAEETEKAVRANTEFAESVEKEQTELQNLRHAINNANAANGERASLIQQLNNKYGQYLGFLVTEENYLRNQEYIYKLLNAQIARSIALKMQEKMVSDIASKYVDQQREAYEDMTVALNETKHIGETGAADATAKLMTSIKEQAQMGVDDVNEVLATIGGETFQKVLAYRKQQLKEGIINQDDFNKYIGQLRFDTFGEQASNLANAVKDMLDIEINIAKESEKASDLSKASLDAFTKNVEGIKKEEIEDIIPKISTTENAKELQEYQQKLNSFIQDQKNSIKGLTAERAELNSLTFNEEAQLKEINDKLAKKQELTSEEQKQYELLIKKQNEELELSEEKEKQWKAINDQVATYDKALKEVDKKLFKIGGQSLWGPNENLSDKSPQELAGMYAKLEKDASRLSKASFKNIGEVTAEDGKKYVTQFWKNFDTREEAIKWYKQQKAALAKQLDELGYNVRGKFKTDSAGDSDSEQRAQARRDYQAAMSALEAYYKEYEDFIRQKRADMKITEEEMNRQILDNDRKFNEDRQQLIKKFLGDENTFDKTKYVGILSNYDYFKDKDLDKMAAQYQRWGDAMTDGGRNQIAKSGVAIRKALNKEQEKIKAELLKGDIFATFENNFAEMLDELGVLTSELEDWADETLNAYNKANGKNEIFGMSPEERQERIHELVSFADQSYQVNADGLRRLMMQNTAFANWAKYLTDDQMNVMLLKLRGYYDDRLALTKRHQEQMKKEFEAFYEQSGQQNSYDRQKQSIDKSKAYQSGLEEYGVRPDYDKNRENIAKQATLDLKKKDSEIDYYEEQWSAANDKLFKAASDGNEEQLRVAQAEMQAAWDAMAQAEIERNELLAQSQRDLTQVYMDEWTKRAERWGQWGEMFGEYLGEQVMLEKQANDARARGDLETAKKIEQQQKQNKQALIQNLLSKIVDEAALWAKEYALKMMFNSLMLAEDKKKAIEEATLQGKSSMLSILLNALTGQSKEHAKGIPGLVTGAIIFAATMALQAFAKSAIANMFPEAATESSGTRKLSTGMLTYAEGNYPVLGNDGKVYDAKYEGAGMKTGVYGGGAHFGIFSEKQPEMIVDGKTTQKIILNYPYIYDAITTIAKNGRLKNAMPTFATGDYPAGMKQLAQIAEVDASTGSNEEMVQMRATMDRTNATIDRLSRLLEGGISAHLDGLENYRQQKKNERFLKRRGID